MESIPHEPNIQQLPKIGNQSEKNKVQYAVITIEPINVPANIIWEVHA